jgi:hypothetical protein
MTNTAKEIVAQRQAATDALLAKIASAENSQALESVLAEDDDTTLVYANATPADQQKIESAVEARLAALA